MPVEGSLPSFNKGDRLKAADLQALSDGIARSKSTPGTFLTGAFTVTRKLAFGGSSATVVAITDAIAAPTWNAGTAKLTPTDCEFPVFYPHEDDTWTIDSETTTTFKSFLKVTIDAPATGKYRRGIVVDGKLIAIQCEEEDLPAGWGE